MLTVIVILGLAVLAYYYIESGSAPHETKRIMENAVVGITTALICFTIELSPTPPTIPPVSGNDYEGYRPHYQGHGVNTSAGRFGEIRRVNNATELVTAARGRQGCDNTPTNCARIIIFDTSGNYNINGQLTIDSPYLTIAGQTAPNDGVTLVNTRLLVDTHDVVVQHLRVRHPPRSLNACSIGDAGDGGDNAHVYNVVYDHITCTWANEVNNLLVAGPNSHDISILDSFIAEGLWPGKLGGIGAGIGYKNTVARNIFSNHWSRQPIWGSPAELALYNNVSYNGTDNSHGYDTLPAFFGDADGDGSNGTLEQTVVMNNILIPGPNSGQVAAILGISKKQASIDAGSKIYMIGNQGPLTSPDQWVSTICLGSYGNYPNAATCGDASNLRTETVFPWFTNFNFVVIPTSETLAKVLANAGSRPTNRDTADTKMIADIQNRTGTHYLDDTSITIPTIAVTNRPCQLPANPNEIIDAVGRTMIERYLESDPICGAQRLEVK